MHIAAILLLLNVAPVIILLLAVAMALLLLLLAIAPLPLLVVLLVSVALSFLPGECLHSVVYRPGVLGNVVLCWPAYNLLIVFCFIAI